MTGPSGLKDPARAVRGVGSGALALEAVVLLLAIQPIRMLGEGWSSGAAVAVAAGAAAVAVALAGLMRFPWAWWAGGGLQVALIAAGFVHWSLAALGTIFGLVWAFLLYVRRRVR